MKCRRILTVAIAILIATAAQADLIHFGAPLGLTGAQEVPAKVTPAVGIGSGVYDTVTMMLTVHLEWQDLLAPASASHIHVSPSGPGVNGPVAIDFVPAGFPNVTTGSFDHTFDLTNAASYGGGFLGSFGGNVDLARAAFLTGLTENRNYFNIHNSINPGGEIRGDITVVPEPATLALFGLGAAVAAVRRRKS